MWVREGQRPERTSAFPLGPLAVWFWKGRQTPSRHTPAGLPNIQSWVSQPRKCKPNGTLPTQFPMTELGSGPIGPSFLRYP